MDLENVFIGAEKRLKSIKRNIQKVILDGIMIIMLWLKKH